MVFARGHIIGCSRPAPPINMMKQSETPGLSPPIGPVGDLSKLAGVLPHSLDKDGNLEVELQAIIGATNELGMQTPSRREV